MFDDKSYLRDQSPLRKRLIVIMKHSEQCIAHVAREIGFAKLTLTTFLDGKDTNWPCLCKIEKYVLKYENYLKLKDEGKREATKKDLPPKEIRRFRYHT